MTAPTAKTEPSWAQLTDEELLAWRIRDLGLTIVGTELETRIEQLWQELGARGITFLPQCYLADEWFCPNEVPTIAIPFYLAHPRLKQLESHIILEVEGGTKQDCMRLLRHECGHALGYAYRLWRRKRWREHFGDFRDDYPESYRPKPHSRRFVRHLEKWYAQYHPDEDFAETFAVWLNPSSNWHERYRGWPALKKLEYVDELMRSIAGQPAPVTGGRRICEASRLTQKLSTYYARKRREYAEDMPDFFDRDLNRIFLEAVPGQKHTSASAFLRRQRRSIVANVSRWTGERKFTVARFLQKLIARCHERKLVLPDETDEAIAQTIAFLTATVMNYRFQDKIRRHP